MSREGECKKCFTVIWKIENATYCWQIGKNEWLESPLFKVDELEETKWKLRLYDIIGDSQGFIGFWLDRDADSKYLESVQLDYELAFLASDRTVLQSKNEVKKPFQKSGYAGTNKFQTRNQVYFTKRSMFLPQNTLTARCRIWKSDGEFTKEVQCFARTRIVVEKRSCLWRIENFSTLESDKKQTYEIKSQETDANLMCLELGVNKKLNLEEKIRISIIPNYEIIKVAYFQLFVVDASNNLVECFQDEFLCHDSCERKEFDLFLTKRKLMEKKAAYLPNDVFSLQCEFSFSSGIVQHEIKSIDSTCTSYENNELYDRCFQKENEITDPKCILINNLKSMVNNSCFSDVKLKTKSQTYPAHTVILGARSPVFRAMFSSDMKEKVNECVDIDDFNDDTVLRLLGYIYSAEVEKLEWSSATQLYEAADKYEVLDLKGICSSYLRNNLCPSNACEALVLADLHQDEDFKSFVQYFILRHGKDVINSEEWEQLEATNLKLAYETIRLRYKEELK